MVEGTGDAYTLTSSLMNKGAMRVLQLARRLPDRRFIIVCSPAHSTHGSPDFTEEADALDNVEVWDRLHPKEMSRLWAETRILLVPSRYETYGLSALEAAWHTIPSIHVDTVHVREGIGAGARLLRSHSIDELSAAVEEVERDYLLWSMKAHNRAHELREREIAELAAFAAGVAGLK
jgi:glycogen synthase